MRASVSSLVIVAIVSGLAGFALHATLTPPTCGGDWQQVQNRLDEIAQHRDQLQAISVRIDELTQSVQRTGLARAPTGQALTHAEEAQSSPPKGPTQEALAAYHHAQELLRQTTERGLITTNERFELVQLLAKLPQNERDEIQRTLVFALNEGKLTMQR